MSEKATVNLNVLKSLMWELREAPVNAPIDTDTISESMLNVNRIKKITTMEEAVDNILNGDTVLFLDEDNAALSIATRAWEHRGVEAPQTENSVRGPWWLIKGRTKTINWGKFQRVMDNGKPCISFSSYNACGSYNFIYSSYSACCN